MNLRCILVKPGLRRQRAGGLGLSLEQTKRSMGGFESEVHARVRNLFCLLFKILPVPSASERVGELRGLTIAVGSRGSRRRESGGARAGLVATTNVGFVLVTCLTATISVTTVFKGSLLEDTALVPWPDRTSN